MNKYLVILLSLLFPCMLLAQNKGIRAVDNKGTIIYVDPSKWFEFKSNLFNKNTNGNVAIGLDTTNVSFNSRLYIYNDNSTTTPALKLDKPFDGELTDDVLTWDPSDFSVRKIAISTLSPNDWHLLGNAGTDPATNFLGTTDDQPLIFKINNQQSGALTSVFSGANTSFGHYSLQNPNVAGGGINNSAFGAGALILTSTGANNTAMGVTALQNNTTGGNNTAVGMNSMTNSITGSDNVAMGMSALFGNAAGSGNTAIGASAGYNVVGNYNTLIGLKSGLSIRSGTNNTVIGGSSTGDITVSADNASNELNIGNALYGTGINNAAGANTGKIGINTNDPQAQLDVNGQARVRTLPTGLVATDKIVTADTDGNLRTLLPADLVPATTVSNTSSVNTLTTTVNDVTGTGVNIINSNTLTATDGNLVSRVNGVETTPAVPVLVSADNGLTATNGKVQLGGGLTKPTTIATTATNTLAISGLQTVTAPTTNDNLVTTDASGVLHQRTVADAVGSVGWLITGNGNTSGASNFIGTTNDQYLSFKVNGTVAGMISTGTSTVGKYNTAFGYRTLSNWQTTSVAQQGSDNTAFGNEALALGGTASDNTAFGYGALRAATSNIFAGNTAVGSLALYAANGNTLGRNTAVGYLALRTNTTGSYNTAVGTSSLNFNTTGNNNTALGNLALQNLNGGSYNVAVGNAAGILTGMAGSSNILIGCGFSAPNPIYVNPSSTSASNELNIGNTLFGTGVNDVAGNTTGRIGINTNAPATTLDVNGQATVRNLTTGSGTDNIVVADPTTGLLKKIAQTPYSEPWQVASSTTPATTNTQNIYQNATVGIGDFSAAVPLTNLDVRGSVRTGSPNTGATIGATSFAGGTNTQATNTNSFAFGNGAVASGTNSFAGGNNTNAYNINTFAFGNGAIAGVSGASDTTNYGAVAFGSSTAAGNYSFAAGPGNKALANYSASFGQNNTINSTATVSFAAGYKNEVNSSNSAAFGANNFIYNTYNTPTSAQNSVVMGSGNKTDANSSVALGANNTNYASYSVAMGNTNTITNGSSYSVAMGQNNRLDNNSTGAFISGQMNVINNGVYSAAIGQNNTINSANGTIIGAYATIPTSTVGSTILADVYNGSSTTVSATAANQFTGMFNGGYRFLTNRSNQVDRGMFIVDDNNTPTRAKVGINNPTPNADLDVQGSQVVKVTIVPMGSYTVKANDYLLIVNTGTIATNTITLPAANLNKGRVLVIKTSLVAGSGVTIKTTGTDVCDGTLPTASLMGLTTVPLGAGGISVGNQITLVSDGISSWYGN
ncbi:beta strand repeat-containing protein [Flavobacterium foetidum]|uniref:beta strand repeat-containing protein n=1 Tax=Flavobacterium foetidum TaxID=2026681 RepID=UPI001075272A|nr:hypothetical protein [Flavobacterium foetidum]KAF2515551.1 hypothetical protein E0W73_08125 [Flavobacterium foetidum]